METRKNYTVISEKERPTVTISPIIYQKISKLCQKINKVEWSGVLFYEIIGDLNDISKVVFEVKDIFLMDIGSVAYTEYEIGTEVTEYMVDNPELLDCYMGHIHSHNSMKTFFSGTDLDELYENSFDNKPYLSLIVNNMGEYCAKVAMNVLSTSEKKTLHFEDSYGKRAVKSIPEKTFNLIFVNDCNVVEKLDSFDNFNSRISELIKSKKKVKTHLQPHVWVNNIITDNEYKELDKEITKLIDNFKADIEGSETKPQLAKKLLDSVYKTSIITEFPIDKMLENIEMNYHEFDVIMEIIYNDLLNPIDNKK